MNNVEKIRRRFGSTGIHRHESNYILGAMQKVAEVLMSYIKSDAEIPIDTHNLKDSTGIALYSPGGALRMYIPNPKAKVPRVTRGLGVYKKARFGNIELRTMILMGASKYKDGYYLVVYSSMPYAGVVNNTTNDYFSRIKVMASLEIEQILRMYKYLTANPV